MLENLYTTKMSANKKQLQNRFTKIRSKNGRLSKLLALIIFAVILLVMACVSVMVALHVNIEDYSMTEEEFSEFVKRPVGATMADIDYADEHKIVFHYGEGFFILHKQDRTLDPKLSSEIDFVINLKKLNLSYNEQGSSVLDIKIDKAGNYAYLSTVGPEDEIKDNEEYIIYLDNGNVDKGSMPENTALFTGSADTLTTVQNPVGLYSNHCIVSGEETYYLSSPTGRVSDIQLVTVCHQENDKTDIRYVFGKDAVSLSQRKHDLIHETLSDDEEILVNSGLSGEVNADVVKSVLNKLSETRQMAYIDVKDGNYDVTIYHIEKPHSAFPRLYIIDNDSMKLLFSSDLSKEEYSDIIKIIHESQGE